MITNKEIIGILLIFIITYSILYIDHKINIKCNCDKYKSFKTISIKVPLLMSIVSLIIYKISEQYINNYFAPVYQIKQNIITDMVDF
jgi:hypothetical protein